MRRTSEQQAPWPLEQSSHLASEEMMPFGSLVDILQALLPHPVGRVCPLLNKVSVVGGRKIRMAALPPSWR